MRADHAGMSTPTTTAERLQAYRDAEAQILLGQEVRIDLSGSGQQVWRGADLGIIQTEIRALERRLASEQAAAAGAPRIGGLGFGVADFGGSY